MRLALIFDKTRPDTTGIYFERACQTLGLTYEHWSLRDGSRIPASYDLYLRIDHGDDYTIFLPQRLRPSVFYAIDTHLSHSWPKIKRLAGSVDFVFCAQSAAARELHSEWLPVACDPSTHPNASQATQWDVAFVGTEGGLPRKFILQAIREKYPNSFIGQASHTRLMDIYGCSKIGFNYAIRCELNMRFFEILGSGALLVTNALRDPNDSASLGLQAGEHFIAYENPRQIFPLMDHWLQSERQEQRVRIAQAGMRLVRQRHSYTHRLRQLLDVVSQKLGIHFGTASGAQSADKQPMVVESLMKDSFARPQTRHRMRFS